MEQYDCIVIGAGIIGLTTAYSLQKKHKHLKLAIVDKEKTIASHQTKHNSGVIHSGIYYQPHSLKAINCRRGQALLLAFAKQHKIAYDICGKIILATNEVECKQLEKIYQRGLKNRISDLRILNAKQIEKIEPHAKGSQAIHCPSTGIIDYSQVADTLLSILLNNKTSIKCSTKVTGILFRNGKYIVQTTRGDIETKKIINCAGLYTDKIASLFEKKINIKIIPFRGEYYSVKKESQYKIKNLIYPVANPLLPFLGIHFTRKMDGTIEAGPNAVLAGAREGYKKTDINIKEVLDFVCYRGFWKLCQKNYKYGLAEILRSFSKKRFVQSLQALVPSIEEKDLEAGEQWCSGTSRLCKWTPSRRFCHFKR